MGLSRQVGEMHVTEPQRISIWPRRPAVQAPRARLDGEEAGIKGPVMDGAQDEPIPGVV
jgi:hypothetical protein